MPITCAEIQDRHQDMIATGRASAEAASALAAAFGTSLDLIERAVAGDVDAAEAIGGDFDRMCVAHSARMRAYGATPAGRRQSRREWNHEE